MYRTPREIRFISVIIIKITIIVHDREKKIYLKQHIANINDSL